MAFLLVAVAEKVTLPFRKTLVPVVGEVMATIGAFIRLRGGGGGGDGG